MNHPRQILVVEDVGADYELITHELARCGLGYSTKRIETPAELAEEMGRQLPEVVLCDHGSASWDSLAVLEQVQLFGPGVPFILVTGAMEPAILARALANGADEHVAKDRLEALGPAVRRALRLVQERRLRVAAEQERDRLRRELEAVTAKGAARKLMRICARCKRIPDDENEWVQLELYFHRRLSFDFSHGLCPECMEYYCADLHRLPG